MELMTEPTYSFSPPPLPVVPHYHLFIYIWEEASFLQGMSHAYVALFIYSGEE